MTQSQRHEVAAVNTVTGAVVCLCGNTFADYAAMQAHFAEVNRDPMRVHKSEQSWAGASESLDKVVAYVRSQEPELYRIAGGNTDASVLFDYMKGYIVESERQAPGSMGHMATVLFCAAAITRLVRAPLTNDALAQLDKEIEDNDDH